MKLNMSDFSFLPIYRSPDDETWKNWFKIIGIKDKSNSDKQWLKKFREELKTKTTYVLRVKHKHSKLFKDCEIDTTKPDRKALMTQCIEAVRELRKNYKVKTPIKKSWCGAEYETIGGVFLKKQVINEIGQSTTYNNPEVFKKPNQEKVNYIGIELEFRDDFGKSKKEIIEAMKKHKLGKYLQVGTDPTCGYEIRVLIREEGFEEPLGKILKVLNDMGAGTDKSCGTHVHMDMRNRDVKRVYKNLFYTQTFMRKFLTSERKKNTYCLANKMDTFDAQVSTGGRYYGINCQAYSEHKTIEIRMHHGTLNPDELIPWIGLLKKIVNYSGELTSKVDKFDKAKEVYAFEPELAGSLKKRLLAMKPKVSKKPMSVGA